MTATVENPAAEGGAATTTGTGRVARVTGPVVDVEFSGDQMPDMYNALHVDVKLGDVTQEAHPGGRAAHRRQHGARNFHAAD